MTLFEGILPQKHKRERERKSASELDAKWYGNSGNWGNMAPQVEFPSSVLPVVWMCTTVFAWFMPSLMNCRVWSQVIAFGPYRFTMFRAHFWQKNSCNIKVVFNHFDRDSCYIYMWYYMILYIKWMNWCAPFLDNPIEYVLAFICVCVVKHWGAPLLFHQTKKKCI